MRTQFLNVLSAIVLFVALAGAGASGTTKQIPLKVPSFSWTPSKNILEKNGLTFAVVAPTYKQVEIIDNWGYGRIEPFKSFSNSMVADMEELLTARGYNIRGPFATRDEMVYADKQACDLAIIIDIEPTLQNTSGNGAWKRRGVCEDKTQGYAFDGVLTLFGKINLTAVEPISGEKIWAKSVEIPISETPQIKSIQSICGGENLIYLIYRNPSLSNPVTELLQTAYGDILDKIWNHLDPNEFARDMQRIKELKKK